MRFKFGFTRFLYIYKKSFTKYISFFLSLCVGKINSGWVDTDMGSFGGRAPPLDATTSVSGVIQVIENLQQSDSGKFFNYDGRELPW